MSAEKCGNGFTIVLPSIETPIPKLEPSFGNYATKMLQRILNKDPTFDPTDESDIWLRARSLGMIEEE